MVKRKLDNTSLDYDTASVEETNIEESVKIEYPTPSFDWWKPSHDWTVKFFNQHPEIKIGVEVGVAAGDHIHRLLSDTKIEKIWGVDPYVLDSWDLSGYIDMDNQYGGFDNFYSLVSNRLSSHGDRVELIRMTSVEAAKKFKDNSLDFVYIDGDHTDIQSDVDAWESKVKPGGYIMGHDWMHPSFGTITDVLTQYYGERITGIDGPVHVWYVKKN